MVWFFRKLFHNFFYLWLFFHFDGNCLLLNGSFILYYEWLLYFLHLLRLLHLFHLLHLLHLDLIILKLALHKPWIKRKLIQVKLNTPLKFNNINTRMMSRVNPLKLVMYSQNNNLINTLPFNHLRLSTLNNHSYCS